MEGTMKRTLLIFVLVFVFGIWLVESVQAQGAGRAGFVRKNSAGGVSAGRAGGFKGPNAASAHASSVATDGQGNAVGGSTRAFKGAGGQTGVRAGGFNRSSDGTIEHKSSAAVEGEKGYANTQRSFSKDSQGNVSGKTETNVNSKSGGNYQGSTTYETGSGVSHSGTCYDAGGNVVPCPEKK